MLLWLVLLYTWDPMLEKGEFYEALDENEYRNYGI